MAMRTATPRVGRLPSLEVGLLTALVSSGAACTYDFDEPFSGATAAGGGTSVSSSSSSSSSSSGGAAGGGGASSGGSGPGGSGTEDCLDGADNDDDGLVDCADPSCAALTCLDAAPGGWSGPVALSVGAAPPACPAAWPSSADFGTGAVLAGPAQCGACACAPGNVTCSLASTNVYPVTSCQGAVDVVLSPSQPGVCSAFASTDADTFEGLASNASGSCAASGGGVVSKPSPTWSSAARVCSGATFGGGCAAGVCVQAPPGSSLCITAPGDQPCPAGSYSSKTTIYGGFADGRDCTACGCGGAIGNCSAQTEVWISPGCIGLPDATIANDGNSCQHEHLLDVPNGSFKFTATGGAGTCASTGGQPTGAVAPAMPTTVCCAP